MDSSKKPYIRYVNRDDVPSRSELIDTYKIICGRILTKDKTVIGNIRIANPNTVCSSSWGMLFTSKSKSETENACKYVRTKLFRFLVKCLGEDGVIALSSYRFSLVPLQDFTSNSDIDWSQSVNNIEHQLYAKFSLTTEEIQYIEQTIKPME